jgi:hypothetical protein
MTMGFALIKAPSGFEGQVTALTVKVVATMAATATAFDAELSKVKIFTDRSQVRYSAA